MYTIVHKIMGILYTFVHNVRMQAKMRAYDRKRALYMKAYQEAERLGLNPKPYTPKKSFRSRY